jgi:predicted ribonuclease YlaK
VIDTNVWIAQLDKIEMLLCGQYPTKVIVYVPWTVLRELDVLKSFSKNPQVASSARKATNVLLQHFEARNPRLCGQSGKQEKAASKEFDAESPDDRILQSCLQLRTTNHHKKVELFTKDRNLAVKAAVSGVTLFKFSSNNSNSNNNSSVSLLFDTTTKNHSSQRGQNHDKTFGVL